MSFILPWLRLLPARQLVAITVLCHSCCRSQEYTAAPGGVLPGAPSHALPRLYLPGTPLWALDINTLSNITIFSVIFSSWLLNIFPVRILFLHIITKSFQFCFRIKPRLSWNWSHCRTAYVTKAQTSCWRQYFPLGNQGFLTRKVRLQNAGLHISNTSAEIALPTQTEGLKSLMATVR